MHPSHVYQRLVGLFLLFPALLLAQQADMTIARRHIDTLCSATMAGRGYLHEGHLKAAYYLRDQFAAFGLKPISADSGYFQPFSYPLNVTHQFSVAINGQALAPGKSCITNRFSGSGNVQGKITDLGYALDVSQTQPGSLKGKIALYRPGWPDSIANNAEARKRYAAIGEPQLRLQRVIDAEPAAIILVQQKLTAGFALEQTEMPIVEVLAADLPAEKLRKAAVRTDVRLDYIKSHNVIGVLPGRRTDSLMLVTAHYDHLGMQGEALFPGANDNASGTTMLLEMARIMAKNQPEFTTLFIAFGAEECGLLGSAHYVRHPAGAKSLQQIRFVLNLDLMGNGDKGMTAVAAKEFPAWYGRAKALNDSLQVVPELKMRANAPNSDHYFFAKSGIPALFFYTEGGPPHYHDVNDTAANLLMSRFAPLCELFILLMNN